MDGEGKPLYDVSSFTITRYLGGDYFVGARSGKCEIVHLDGRTIIPTDIYPTDPTRVANVGYLPDSKGGKLMVADKLMSNLAIYDTSGAIIYQRTSTDYSLNWGLKDDYIYITEGNKTGLVDLNGEEVLPIKYRHLAIFKVDGEIKYLKTSQIYADRINPTKGGLVGWRGDPLSRRENK